MTARELTENEVRVIKRVLSSTTSESDEERIRQSGLPRMTYKEAKQRLYSAQILEDRYVPTPVVMGVKKVSFLLTSPSPGMAVSVAQALNDVPGVVLIWSGERHIFSVTFSIAGETVTKKEEMGEVIIHLSIEPTAPLIPIYFDYEGAWSRFTGIEGIRRYPRSLPLPARANTLSPRALRNLRAETSLLLSRPSEKDDNKRYFGLLGPTLLPRSKRRLVEEGMVEWRSFLSVEKVPSYLGWRLSDITFLYGRLKDEEKGLYTLYHALVGDCRIFPFLLASDGREVLIGSLATEPMDPRESVHSGAPPTNVTQVLSAHLTDFRYVREAISTLRVHRSHRYDLLLNGPLQAAH